MAKGGKADLVLSDYASVSEEVEIYRRDHRRVGGSGGWRVDEVMVDHMCAVLRGGGRVRTACRVVGLPYGIFRKWLILGERLRERCFMEADVVLTDEEEGYLYLYNHVIHELGMHELKASIVVDRAMLGQVDLSAGRLAMDVLSRCVPEDWERKNGMVVDSGMVGSPLRLVSDRTDMDMREMRERKKEERDRVVSERRMSSSGGVDGG